MARLFRLNLRLQSLVLLVLIPGLLLSTALFGVSIYQVLYGIIMTGFDQKLYAVSTVTGSFIEGADHDEVFARREIRALAAGIEGEELMGIDAVTGRLYSVDTAEGGALDAAPLPATAHALASDPAAGSAWVVTSEPLALHRLDASTGEASVIGSLSNLPDGLAYAPTTGRLYAGGDRLTEIDPATGAGTPLDVEGLSGEVRAPAFDSETNTLYLLHGDGNELVAVDLTAGAATVIGPLHDPEPLPEEELLFGAGGPATVTALAVSDAGLVGAADRLLRIDPETAAVDSSGTASGFRSSRHPAYLAYVEPMRRIMAKKDITYLYTENVQLGGLLTYGIDATEGEDHSIIGTAELIADDDVPAMERAMVEGTVRLSDLEEWDAWGLLKTADAPIFRDDGSVAALAAADVDISVILEKTRVALVQVGLVAALTLLIGALVSLMISRRLVSPLTEVKEGALQLAAGSYGHRIADQQLLELGELSESFNSMSEALGATISELSKTNLALENVRRRRALEVALADPNYEPDPGLPFVVERSEARDGGDHNPSGYVHIPGPGAGRVLVWLAEPLEDAPIDNLRLRREVAAIARPMVTQHVKDWGAAATFLEGLFPRLSCLVLIDAETRTVQVRARRSTPMAVVSAEGLIREVDVSTIPSFVVGPREWVVVAAHDPLAATESIRRDRIIAAPVGNGIIVRGSRRRSGDTAGSQMSVALFGQELLVEGRDEHALAASIAETVTG